ncbi:23S rRNA (uracil(1939)-C(5))-methyltransferase RlmD [Chryseomicrobium sp. FSL W7-1435]|uniref:23S rRNA (uracil(1939)-C(5))-methyltransferase RlmD n=1 Tax=Chryseomicrobium sp. FSL W7-1435 TaxID=2921704 RepID=UPI00315B0425
MSEKVTIKVGQEFPLTIKRLGINGEGVGFFKKHVVFVPGALPGEVITAHVTDVQRKFATAKIKQIREASEDRVTPPCPVYEECGGCQLQHMTYARQILEKRDIVLQALERYSPEISEDLVKATIGMDNPWNYRNKSQFQVRERSNKVLAGLFAAGSNFLVDIDDCLVQHPETTAITNQIKAFIEEKKIPVYDERNPQGVIRSIVVRKGIETQQLQVTLITTKKKFPNKEELTQAIVKMNPEIVSISQNINADRTSLIFGETTFNLWGKETMTEKLDGLLFDLSARAFFQLNPIQTVHLYNEIKKAAHLTGEENVVDAYCGVGTIGLWLAADAKEVRGMDNVPEAVADAKKNAARNNLHNTQFAVGTPEEWVTKWQRDGFKVDVLTADPPRTGLDSELMDVILRTKPKRFVYTSCNPSTLAKDLATLTKKYTVVSIQPVDMFPQTAQIECVVELVLN